MAEADIKRVSQGYLQRNQAFATVIEAPGFYEGDTEDNSRRVVETELRKIGLLTHVVVVWHALELRDSDLDVVLSEIRKYFGSAILDKLIFAVTFCDSGSKAKKYRSKRGISFNSISAMICQKVAQSFSTEEPPLIYFLCAKQPRDPSRKELVRFLNSDLQWSAFPVNTMKSWTSLGVITSQEEEEKIQVPAEDDYEAVDEDVFETEERPGPAASSKSLSNLHQESQPRLPRGGGVSASTTALHQEAGRGSRLFSSNRRKLSSTTSSSTLQHQHKAAGRGKSQPNLFGGSRSRSRSRSNLAQTTSSLALEQGESRRGRGSSRSGSRARPGQTSSQDNLDLSRQSNRGGRGRGRGGGGAGAGGAGGGGGQSSMFRSRSKSRGRSGLAKTRSDLALQDSQPNLSQPNLYGDSPVRGPADSDTPDRRPRGRMFSSGSTGSTARRRGRSKSRDRLRQSRQNLRQSESLPRPRTEDPEEPERTPMRRSRSQWSVGSSANRRRQQQRKSGDCVIL